MIILMLFFKVISFNNYLRWWKLHVEQLKVELPDNVSDAITAAVFDSFRKAREASQSDDWPLYLSKKQACKYLNISNKTLSEWISTGDIPYKHIGKTYRFNRNDLDKFMATK